MTTGGALVHTRHHTHGHHQHHNHPQYRIAHRPPLVDIHRHHLDALLCSASPHDPPATESASETTTNQRAEWISTVRSTTGRKKHRLWSAIPLHPPPLLADIAVVLVSPKRPSTIGAVARALNCFECVDLRVVCPRCDPLARSARNSSKGAQYILWSASVHDTLKDALEHNATSNTMTIAFTRWVQEQIQDDETSGNRNGIQTIHSIRELVSSIISTTTTTTSTSTTNNKVVLVFGREAQGLTDEEVMACTAVCSIPMGRLQESLSLSHAVSLVLGPIFEERSFRDQTMEHAPTGGGNAPRRPFVVERRQDLVAGVHDQDD